MTSNTRLPAVLLSIALVGTIASPAHAQHSREDWQRAPAVYAAMDISRGSAVADVGAGSGWFTERLSRVVGPSGRVFAVDIARDAIRELRQLVAEESLGNVTVIHSEPDDPELPPRSVDAALMVMVYHHLRQRDQREVMLANIREALRPGGRFVIVESTADSPAAPRAKQMKDHGLEMRFAVSDLRRAGFDIVERVDVFTKQAHPDHDHPPYIQWMLVARRPRPDAR